MQPTPSQTVLLASFVGVSLLPVEVVPSATGADRNRYTTKGMPSLRLKDVDQEFRFLVDEHGFQEAEHQFPGPEIHVTYRKGKRGLAIEADSINPYLPWGYAIIYRDENSSDFEKLLYLDNLIRGLGEEQYNITYPFHEKLWSAWWPLSWYFKWKYRAEREREFNQRIADLARFIRENYDDVFTQKIRPVPAKKAEQEKGLKQVVYRNLKTSGVILLIALVLYVLFPGSSYWIWALVVGGLVIALTISMWNSDKENIEMEAILEKHRRKKEEAS